MRLKAMILLSIAPAVALAQAPAPRPEAAVITAALSPLPAEFRETATVLQWTARWATAPLRAGSGPMICLADNPFADGFHAACYHRDLEPYMERGRELRRADTTARAAIDSVRYAEINSGKLPMPKIGTIWQLSGADSLIDWSTGEAKGPLRGLNVVHLPGATVQSTGLPTAGPPGTPWLMFPGTPASHIMLVRP